MTSKQDLGKLNWPQSAGLGDALLKADPGSTLRVSARLLVPALLRNGLCNSLARQDEAGPLVSARMGG